MPARAIVLTSIQAPTPQVAALVRLPDSAVFFVADRKTPVFEPLTGLTVLSCEEQRASAEPLVQGLPWNHYARKNLGYLEALRSDASWLYDTDDDNAPHEGWLPAPPTMRPLVAAGQERWVNCHAHFGGGHSWPRGFPLERIGSCEAPALDFSASPGEVVVWQGLVTGDPDVDAVQRLTRPAPPVFASAPPLVLPEGTFCPFNSQNTLWRRAAFPYLYLPSTVSSRVCDILRSYIAQRCFWVHGWRLGFTQATAHQVRNPHVLLRDFRDEVPLYLHADAIATALGALDLGPDAAENLRRCYERLVRGRWVDEAELPRLEAWIDAAVPRVSASAAPDAAP